MLKSFIAVPTRAFNFQLMGMLYPVVRISSSLLQSEFYIAHTPVGEIEVTLPHAYIVKMPEPTDAQKVVVRAFRAQERAWNGLGEYLCGVLDDGRGA